VVLEWYWSREGVGGEWSDKELRCSGSRMYLVGVCGVINMMCGDDIVQDVYAVRG
jgi:hypothetical protein